MLLSTPPMNASENKLTSDLSMLQVKKKSGRLAV